MLVAKKTVNLQTDKTLRFLNVFQRVIICVTGFTVLKFYHFRRLTDDFQRIVKALFYIHFQIAAVPVCKFAVFGAFAIIKIIE